MAKRRSLRSNTATSIPVSIPLKFDKQMLLRQRMLWLFNSQSFERRAGRVPAWLRNIDQMDNNALDKWFEKQDYNTREGVDDVFYVNGDNNLENLRRLDQTWKVRLIEEEFKRLMFDVEDV